MRKTKKAAGVVPTHYEVMGVCRSSSFEQLKDSWRALSRVLHPDRNGGTPEANERFAQVTAAYAVLSDIKARARYDAGLTLITDECSICHGDGAVYKQKGFVGKVGTICAKCGGSGRVVRC